MHFTILEEVVGSALYYFILSRCVHSWKKTKKNKKKSNFGVRGGGVV
jgi:hypothetical protein